MFSRGRQNISSLSIVRTCVLRSDQRNLEQAKLVFVLDKNMAVIPTRLLKSSQEMRLAWKRRSTNRTVVQSIYLQIEEFLYRALLRLWSLGGSSPSNELDFCRNFRFQHNRTHSCNQYLADWRLEYKDQSEPITSAEVRSDTLPNFWTNLMSLKWKLLLEASTARA